MKITCAPSHVMREGSDLNQHGHAARHEHASSSVPATFQGVFVSALLASPAPANEATLHTIRPTVMDWIDFILFIMFFPFRRFRYWNVSKQRVGKLVKSEKKTLAL